MKCLQKKVANLGKIDFQLRYVFDAESREKSIYRTFIPIRPRFDPQNAKKWPKSSKTVFLLLNRSRNFLGTIIYLSDLKFYGESENIGFGKIGSSPIKISSPPGNAIDRCRRQNAKIIYQYETLNIYLDQFLSNFW